MAAAAPAPPAWQTANANIPAWENQLLNQLGQQGQLSGVPPSVIASIAQAESSGSGGGINSKGYGGWFGLGANTTYPGGTTSTALLKGTDQASFITQAKIAASEFASLLRGANNNLYLAEVHYQLGPNTAATSSEGTGIFAQNGIPNASFTGYHFGNVLTTAAAGAGAAVGGSAAGQAATTGVSWLQSYAKLMKAPGGWSLITNPAQDFEVILTRGGTFLAGFIIFMFGVLIIVGVPILDALTGKARGAASAVPVVGAIAA